MLRKLQAAPKVQNSQRAAPRKNARALAAKIRDTRASPTAVFTRLRRKKFGSKSCMSAGAAHGKRLNNWK